MIKRLALAAVAAAALCAPAAAQNYITGKSAVCDPATPTNCVKPDASGNLPVTGSLSVGGTASNASSAVATSSANGQQVVWNYGFNGATWDQLQVDASKNLKVILQNGSLAVTGTVAATQSGAWTAAVTSTGATSTQANSTVTTHLTYQTALASNTSRKGCLIVNTSADTERVFFGANGSATAANAIPLPAGASISCASGNFVLTDNIAITSVNTDGAAYIVVSQ